MIFILFKSYIEIVDNAVDLAKKNKPTYLNIANDITETLYKITNQSSEKIIGINNRIKTDNSLKEKIIRKKIYKNNQEPNKILGSITDIIGVLIECEFIQDESKIYNCILNDFEFYNEKIVKCKTNDKIFLDTSEMQPQQLKNGSDTYKIDGYYCFEGSTYKFELQIKSMVKVFWSEVEHSIVYKNNYYMEDDMYVINTLDAIKDNLFSLDRMLQLINSHTSTINSSTLLSNLTLNKKLVKQLISETFNDKIMQAIRIKINIKNTRDLVTEFILRKNNEFSSKGKDYNFYSLIKRFKYLQCNELVTNKNNYNVCLDESDSYFTAKNILQTAITKDFEWDLYFMILRNLYPDNSLEYFINETIYMVVDLLDIKNKSISEQNEILVKCFQQGIIEV